METLTLEFSNGSFEATRDGLENMGSAYFDALLNTTLSTETKFSDILVEEFQEMYNFKEWTTVVGSKNAHLKLEQCCNQLFLADRFQMERAFRMLANKLLYTAIDGHFWKDDLPSEVVELLLNNDYDVQLSTGRWTELICVDGFPIDLFEKFNKPSRASTMQICKHPNCTAAILEKFISMSMERDCIYQFVKRGILSPMAGLKFNTVFRSNYHADVQVRVKTGTSPLELELEMCCKLSGRSTTEYIPEWKWATDIATHYEIRDAQGQLVKICTTRKEALEKSSEYSIYTII